MNVLITGSSKGLGRELARCFSANGHFVILHGRNERNLNALYEELGGEGRADMVIGDLAAPSTMTRLAERAYAREIDILINNAATHYHGSTAAMPTERIFELVQSNLIAPLYLTAWIYRGMLATGGGLIVNINSLAGKCFNDKEALYCATKWGLRGFMGSFKYEARQGGVGVMDVYLGAMRTDMTTLRPDPEKLIDPASAARQIYDVCRDYPSLRVSEIEIVRAT